MLLADCVDTWFFENDLKPSTRRKIRYEITNWNRRGGADEIDEISTAEIVKWRVSATTDGLAPRTVESVISTVLMLCKRFNVDVAAGKRLRCPVNLRDTPTMLDINCAIAHADAARWLPPNWWRTAICLAYCSGLRLGDLERFNRDMIHDGCVRWRASKTDKDQRVPVPDSLLPRLAGFRWTIGRKVLRRELRRICASAGVVPFTPQGLRRLAAQEWERARAGCGAIILGHDIPGWSRATSHYMDKSHLLRLGLPSLRLPTWIDDGQSADREAALVGSFRRLPTPQQAALVQVAAGMASG